MSKIKIGDRVSATLITFNVIHDKIEKQKIIGIFSNLRDGWAFVSTKKFPNIGHEVDPRSMRKLIPKKEKEFLGYMRINKNKIGANTSDIHDTLDMLSGIITDSDWVTYKIYGVKVK